jgi:Mn-dependent DtxR family transcriptional regulator
MMHLDGIPFRLCLLLVRRERGAVVFSDEIQKSLNVSSRLVWHRLRSAVRLGWLSYGKDGNFAYYSAGPRLVEVMDEVPR